MKPTESSRKKRAGEPEELTPTTEAQPAEAEAAKSGSPGPGKPRQRTRSRRKEAAHNGGGPPVPASPYTAGPVLAFDVAGQHYGLPVENVVQIIEMVAITRLPATPEIVVGVVDFRGQVIPIVDLRRRFNLPTQPYSLRTPIVVSHLNERTVGLVVDAVSGVIALRPEQVQLPAQIVTEEMALQTRYLSSVARLSDGLLLVLDPATFLSPEEAKAVAKALPRRRRRSKKK